MRLYGRDVFLEPRKPGWMCAVTDRSQTLQYMGVGFGARAQFPRKIRKDCDSGSTPRRATVVVSM